MKFSFSKLLCLFTKKTSACPSLLPVSNFILSNIPLEGTLSSPNHWVISDWTSSVSWRVFCFPLPAFRIMQNILLKSSRATEHSFMLLSFSFHYHLVFQCLAHLSCFCSSQTSLVSFCLCDEHPHLVFFILQQPHLGFYFILILGFFLHPALFCVQAVIGMVDQDGSGSVSYNEFITLVESRPIKRRM